MLATWVAQRQEVIMVEEEVTDYPLTTNLLGFAPRLASNLGHPVSTTDRLLI